MASPMRISRPLGGVTGRVGAQCGTDTASGVCSSDMRHRISQAGCKAAAVVIGVALLDHVRLEGQAWRRRVSAEAKGPGSI